MSKYYTPKKTWNIYSPNSNKPYRLSRSKIDLFLECPRCFYLDRKEGIQRPPGFPFSLNSAVDKLLKKEFDIHRVKKSIHPLMENYSINAIPFQHKDIGLWRDALRGGIQYIYKQTNFLITGGIDDIWVDSSGKLFIVDYKATAKSGEVNIDAEWQITYKRQMEIYQWLFRKNGFDVSNIGYFVYCNGDTDKKAFDGKLEFDIKILPYKGDDSWIEQTLIDIKKCLEKNSLPNKSQDCDYCNYFETREKAK